MADFNKEQALVAYTVLQQMRDAEITTLPDFEERLEAGGSHEFYTDFDPVLWKLDEEAHRHGFFFWQHFEDDGLGGEKSVPTLEEIKPTGAFDILRAEARFNEIQGMPRSIPGAVIQEQEEIAHEAHRNGFKIAWDNDFQRYKCKHLLRESLR